MEHVPALRIDFSGDKGVGNFRLVGLLLEDSSSSWVSRVVDGYLPKRIEKAQKPSGRTSKRTICRNGGSSNDNNSSSSSSNSNNFDRSARKFGVLDNVSVHRLCYNSCYSCAFTTKERDFSFIICATMCHKIRRYLILCSVSE